MAFFVDASVVAAWFLSEEDGTIADHVSIIRLARNMRFPPMMLPTSRLRFRTMAFSNT
ncbi:hypothetical protein At1D1108_07410 [Agrobacterium tumefaciens]|nr:hypothetical protein At1D1108_07410 [Agrobacterium tumefaciens]